MKPGYKIGTLVKYTKENTASFGTVEAVITRANSYEYIVDGFQVEASAIEAGYVPMKRAVSKKTRTRKPKTETVADADQANAMN